MSYNYHDPNPNGWRVSRERGMETNFSLPTQYPAFGNPSESGARNGFRSLPYQHPSTPFTSTGYSQFTYSDGPSQWFAEEAPDSTSVTMASNVPTSSRVYQGGSNQAPGVVQLADDTSGYLPSTRDMNLLPSSARDPISLPEESRSYPVNSVITYPLQAAAYSKMGNYGSRLDGMGMQNLEPRSQKKPESWLIAKFLDSVNSTDNHPSANPAADSARHLQANSSNILTGSQPLPTVQSFMGRYSKDTVAGTAAELAKMTQRESSSYYWHTPPSNVTTQNASPKDGEKVVSSSKMRLEENLPKKESGVDSGTLLAWTEYFRQLYLFNVINHQHGEAQAKNVKGGDGATNLPVDSPKPVPKPGFSIKRDATPNTNAPRGKRLKNPAATTSGSGELKEEFHRQISSEEHCRQYQKPTLQLDSTDDHHYPRPLQMRCKVCNLTIVESFSAHSRRPEHLAKKALIHRGCPLCKVDHFQYFREYAAHMNGNQHKENQIKSRLQYELSIKNTDNSVNVVDSTQDKAANPDSSEIPDDEMTLENKSNRIIKHTEKMIGTAFQPTASQKPKIEIKLSSRQPLLAADAAKAGLVRKIGSESNHTRYKRPAGNIDKSDVVVVESGTGGEPRKRIKTGNMAEISSRSRSIFPATASTTEEKNRKQQISSKDDAQMVKNAADAGERLSTSVKDAATTAIVQSKSTLLECENSIAKSKKGTESEVALLSTVSVVEIGSSSQGSKEQNKTTLNQQDEGVFVAVVGFYCKICKMIYNKEEVSEEQHRLTETHLRNIQAVVPSSLSMTPDPLSSLRISATSKQPRHKNQNEVSMDNKNITEPTRTVNGAHQETMALQQPGNTTTDHQHLTSQLGKGISSTLVHVDAEFDNEDRPRPSDNVGNNSTCKSNEIAAEISLLRKLEEQAPKKLKTENGSACQVQQQNNNDKQLKPSTLEATGKSAVKQGPRKRKLILTKSCITLGNPTEHSKNVRKTLEDTQEESTPRDKNKGDQTERRDGEKKIETMNEDVQVRNKVSYKKPLVIAKARNLPCKQLPLGSISTGNSDMGVLVEVKQESVETDSSLKVITAEETSYLKTNAERIPNNGETIKTNHSGIRTEHASLLIDFDECPSTSDTPQLNDSANLSFNQSLVKKEVITTKENTVQSAMIPKALARISFNNCHSTDTSSETVIEKTNETIQMFGISTMRDMNADDSIAENSVAFLAKKGPGNKLRSGVDNKTAKDSLWDFNADGKNKRNANNQYVAKIACDRENTKHEVGKFVTIGKTVNRATITIDKRVTNEKILVNNRTVTRATDRTVQQDKANDRTDGNGNSSVMEKSATNDMTVTDDEIVTDHETHDKMKSDNKTDATSRMVTKDGATQQNVVPAYAFEKSMIGKESTHKTAVNNKTGKSTTEELESCTIGNSAAATVNSAQSASNNKNAETVANSNTQDNANSETHNPTGKVHNDNSITTSLGSPSESVSKSVDKEIVHDSREEPKPIDSSEKSDARIDNKTEVACVVLPASLENGCAIS